MLSKIPVPLFQGSSSGDLGIPAAKTDAAGIPESVPNGLSLTQEGRSRVGWVLVTKLWKGRSRPYQSQFLQVNLKGSLRRIFWDLHVLQAYAPIQIQHVQFFRITSGFADFR